MNPITLSDIERKKPLSLEPEKERFLYIQDIQAGTVIWPDELDDKDRKKLVLKRLELADEFSVETLDAANKADQMAAIRDNTEMGQMLVRAELDYLKETIEGIRAGDIV